MKSISSQRLTGILFILGAFLVNIPYALLIKYFDYPDILREPAGYVLTRFQEGGPNLIWIWLSFAWVGFPILLAIAMLYNVMKSSNAPYLFTGTVLGLIGGIVQMIGLLRWSFVIPILARNYTDPTSSNVTKESAVIVFQAVHQYGGVVIGEHIGQTFTIAWMFLISVEILQLNLFKPWLGWFGLIASVVYLLAQTDLLATVIIGFPVIPGAGLIGSLLWLLWMIIF